ncbi:hypothetical protein RBU00_18900 [Rhizobium sp. AN63]|uniref:hypothetical protein n=1 Tax=unclassified Rhizobium TaxID=2613769 RepID=UPI0027D354E5|nr:MULTISPECIES: hypothetical protein [unclassified Rhizobium]MDQ4407998.1 hypothetical protein [Rhizobium sp. AN63]
MKTGKPAFLIGKIEGWEIDRHQKPDPGHGGQIATRKPLLRVKQHRHAVSVRETFRMKFSKITTKL